MPTLLDYRRRIRSVKSTQQITRAMKFVAAAKLRRAQEGVFAARPYAREILRVLRSAAARMETTAHPLLERRPEEKVLVVVLTGDRSLAGAFNTNVLRRAIDVHPREHCVRKRKLIVVGKKGRDTLRKRGFELRRANISECRASVEFSKAKEIAARIAELYAKKEVDAVYAIYNEFKNVMVQNLRVGEVAADRSRRFSAEAAGDLRARRGMEDSLPHDLVRVRERLRWSITSTKSRWRRFSTGLCRAIWSPKFSAFCWNRPPPSTPRA